MVAVSKLALGLSAATLSLAAPTTADAAVEARGAPNFILDENHPINLLRRNLTERSNTNYVQNYKTGGNINFTPGTNQFSLTFNTQQDFVLGVGWNPGSTAPITHSGSFSVTSGLGSLSVYGWSTNPLVEYYVMECNHGISTGGSQKGSLTSDGGSYAIWEHQQVNQPSIQGTSTFQQYFSIRQDCVTSGTVTMQNHFQAWAAQGMNLGTLNYQVVSVESWSGAGSATQQVSNDGSGSPSPAPAPGPAPSSPAPAPSNGGGGGGNGGSCSALWGQCGGQGWNGPTCCSQGTCHSNGQYYSQCVQ